MASLSSMLDSAIFAAVKAGVPPRILGWRGVRKLSPEAVISKFRQNDSRASLTIIHPEQPFTNPLPANVASALDLPNDAGWWGYSFRDVPHRIGTRTALVKLPDTLVVSHIDAQQRFWPVVITREGNALAMREMQFRSWHRDTLATAPRARYKRATWLMERVYDNYSHWLTAHLPKLLLLRGRNLADDILLPPKRPAFIDDSMRLLGFDPEQFRTFDPSHILEVEELTVIDSDRFRPELLQSVRAATPVMAQGARNRRIFISREGAARRTLVNEAEVWPMLAAAGFEKVRMESLSFVEQVKLMQEAAVLCAPHGAGLTNMMFCAAGTDVIEIADLSFPNPNFYAVASAMGLRYQIVRAESRGDTHPLEKDLYVEPARLEKIIAQLSEAPSSAPAASL